MGACVCVYFGSLSVCVSKLWICARGQCVLGVYIGAFVAPLLLCRCCCIVACDNFCCSCWFENLFLFSRAVGRSDNNLFLYKDTYN